jgi:hypothetical protein
MSDVRRQTSDERRQRRLCLPCDNALLSRERQRGVRNSPSRDMPPLSSSPNLWIAAGSRGLSYSATTDIDDIFRYDWGERASLRLFRSPAGVTRRDSSGHRLCLSGKRNPRRARAYGIQREFRQNRADICLTDQKSDVRCQTSESAAKDVRCSPPRIRPLADQM